MASHPAKDLPKLCSERRQKCKTTTLLLHLQTHQKAQPAVFFEKRFKETSVCLLEHNLEQINQAAGHLADLRKEKTSRSIWAKVYGPRDLTYAFSRLHLLEGPTELISHLLSIQIQLSPKLGTPEELCMTMPFVCFTRQKRSATLSILALCTFSQPCEAMLEWGRRKSSDGFRKRKGGFALL